MLLWALISLSVLLLTLLGYWLFHITEGAYLGPQVVTLFYDWAASRYDDIKGFSNAEESWFLARPLLDRLAAVPQPLVLDVATGTGRLPLALIRERRFQGRIVGLDLSRRMLDQAALKTENHTDRILLLHQDATLLPFPDGAFDAVTCLEALEFLPHPRHTLREMVRVLRPGGVLLTTNRRGWEARLFFGRSFTQSQIISLLRGMGLVGVRVQSWQHIYDLVWARKPGDLPRVIPGGGNPRIAST
ncbi:MAG: class I SAM-dependent methyltransferase [Chloroflexota bacterium]|nr:class I SAM-dependent methyltransferase [Chloroflexota bacterium]